MLANTILYIALACIAALGLVFFTYIYGAKRRSRGSYLLSGFRFISVFLLLLLLINPTFKQVAYEIEKPKLLLAVDQSASVEYLGMKDSVRGFVEKVVDDKDLQDKFEISVYGFGRTLEPLRTKTIDFDHQQTNVSLALRGLSKLDPSAQSAIILISDGNQTLGEDYEYFSVDQNTTVFPVVVGDTTMAADLSIQTMNVNRYAFLNNRFPVEVVLNYSGKAPVESRFEIVSDNAVLYSARLDFDTDERSKVINLTLPAGSLGNKFYTANISPLPSEKNTMNNSKRFAVEVIDERSSVLILSSIAHPDLGAIKKSIEANEQRQADIRYIKDYKSGDSGEFELIVLYQPNREFTSVFSEIEAGNLNYLLVTGTQTNWDLLNGIQDDFRREATGLTQDISAEYNENYSGFQFEDIGFSKFPPLEGSFGRLKLENENYNSLLFQRIEGVTTEIPLLVTFQNKDQRKAVLFGENIWKWRMQSYVDSRSFESFDLFFGKLVQYLSGALKRDRLIFNARNFYYTNEAVVISAQFFDENYEFQPNGKLMIQIENTETKNTVEAQMLLDNNRYLVEVNELPPGDYNFAIREEPSGIARIGSFSMLEINVEQQFVSSNSAKMGNLAANNSSNLYFLDDPDALTQALVKDNRFVGIQKSREKIVSFADWKILLALLVLSLGAEWFTRKYQGLI